MNKRDREHLAHMLEYAQTAVRVLGPLDSAGLRLSEEKLLAVSRSLQNVGEAANRLPGAVRSSLPAIPWRKVIGMRHRLVHGYDDIRLEVLVQTVHDDLPPLIAALGRALQDNSE